MKKAVIVTGGKQYLVTEGETLQVELLKDTDGKKVTFNALLLIDGDKTTVGTPELTTKVIAEITELDEKADKVTAIRYKAKKRVHKVHGHRQHQTHIKITSIA